MHERLPGSGLAHHADRGSSFCRILLSNAVQVV